MSRWTCRVSVSLSSGFTSFMNHLSSACGTEDSVLCITPPSHTIITWLRRSAAAGLTAYVTARITDKPEARRLPSKHSSCSRSETHQANVSAWSNIASNKLDLHMTACFMCLNIRTLQEAKKVRKNKTKLKGNKILKNNISCQHESAVSRYIQMIRSDKAFNKSFKKLKNKNILFINLN